MEKRTSNIEVTPPNNLTLPPINLQISTDAIVIGGILIWTIWDKMIGPKIKKKLDSMFTPIEEERKLTNILAQIGIITKASRVILAAFHNGSLDAAGYHLQKLSTVNTYTSPGSTPMNYPVRDLPIGRILFEIEEMLKADDWVCVVYNEDLPQPCKDHLLRNDMKKMCNRLVKVGNLPIGILSLQYLEADSAQCSSEIIHKEHENVMNDLYMQISTIMRRRVIYPSPIHSIFGKYLGTVDIRKK
jgi:hypothetical protein